MSHVVVTGPDDVAGIQVLENKTARAVGTPGPANTEAALAMLDNPFHESWNDVAEALASVTGALLHPETRWACDPLAIARSSAGFWVACPPRTDPGHVPVLRPDLDPMANDTGVIVFPVLPGTVLELASAGWTGEALGRAAVTAAITAAGVHEGFERLQRTPGIPNWDPHIVDITIAVEFAGGYGVELAA